MPIYLDEQTRPYLERLIKKQVEKSDKDFIAERIRKMLEADRAKMNEVLNCEHDMREYVGHGEMCCKCNSYGQEEWTLKDLSKIIN